MTYFCDNNFYNKFFNKKTYFLNIFIQLTKFVHKKLKKKYFRLTIV